MSHPRRIANHRLETNLSKENTLIRCNCNIVVLMIFSLCIFIETAVDPQECV